jgi:hypothetical protein
MPPSVSEIFGAFVRHAGGLLGRVLLHALGLLALGMALNLGLLAYLVPGLLEAWQAGQWLSLAGTAVLLPLLLLVLPLYLVLGYRLGLASAIGYAWTELGGPLRSFIAERVVAGVQGRVPERLGNLTPTLGDLKAALASRPWIVRKVVSLLLARVPFADALAEPAVREKLEAADGRGVMQAIVEQRLGQLSVPGFGWAALAALVLVNAGVIVLLAR